MLLPSTAWMITPVSRLINIVMYSCPFFMLNSSTPMYRSDSKSGLLYSACKCTLWMFLIVPQASRFGLYDTVAKQTY
jgi:hypothetical protein